MTFVADDIRPTLEKAFRDKKITSDEKYLLLLKQLVDTVLEDSQLLMNATDELLVLFNEILETMRLESGHHSETKESFNLRDLIKNNIQLMKPVARHRQLKLLSEFDEQIPIYFSGLRHYLERSLLNLLSNALKFTEHGFVKIKVKISSVPRSNYQPGDKIKLKISVEDTGIGIPKDKFETIFEHFSRLSPSFQGLYKGAGLGLYTVKRYIEAMNASIKVESTIGRGTCFIITLPLTVSDHSDRERVSVFNTKKIKIQTKEPLLLEQNDEKLNTAAFILIVEDNYIAAKSAQVFIKNLNCLSHHAENGKKAIQMVKENEYDLILMDIGLPDLNGIEVTHKIRSLNTNNSREVPIIALTGHADEPEMKRKSLEAGMQEVLSKPIAQSKLESILEHYVFKKRQSNPSQKENEALSSETIINWEACLEQMNNDENVLRELLDSINDDLKMSQKILAKAYENHDYETLRKELHRVRGGICYLTLPQLDRALANFHEAVKANPQMKKDLEDSYKVLQEALQSFWSTFSNL